MRIFRGLSALNFSPPSLVLTLAVLALLALTRSFNFLLFHTLAELIAIVVYFAIFTFVWSSRRFMEDYSLLFLGIACLFVGCFDLLHALFFQGVGIIPGDGVNESAQFWIVARLMEGVSLAAVPLLIGHRQKLNLLVPAFVAVALLLAVSILLYPVFPDCRLPDGGESAFMMAAEFSVIGLFAASFFLFRWRREAYSPQVRYLLLAAVVLKIGSELTGIMYSSHFGAHGFASLSLKIISIWMIYMAVVRTGLVRPFDLLFRNLKMRELEREKLIEQLQNALSEVKILSGMLPICAGCKQIRDDKGYWHQVEEYIRSHSETEFTHSYCPECAKKLLDSLE